MSLSFDKLIYTDLTGSGFVLTVDFGGIGELTVKTGSSGEVNWRRLTAPMKDVLKAKLTACCFDSWPSEMPFPVCWGVELFDENDSLAKRILGCSAVPDILRSLLEFCLSISENRSNTNSFVSRLKSYESF